MTVTRTWVGVIDGSCAWDVTATWQHANVRIASISWYYDSFPGDGYVFFTRGNVGYVINDQGNIHGHSITYRITADSPIYGIVVSLSDRDGDFVGGGSIAARTTECPLVST